MYQSPAYARKAHILALLKSGERVSISVILESLRNLALEDGRKLECNRKTVSRDIKDLKDMGCPISWRRSLGSFELRDKTWDMPATPLLGSDEMLAVTLGAQLGTSSLPRNVRRHVHITGQNIIKVNSVEFHHGADLSTLKILAPPVAPEAERIFATVYDAWATRRLLTIRYMDESGNTTNRTIEPQALFFHEMVWYVQCYCYLRSAVRTFAIARIEEAKIVERTFATRPEVYESTTFDNFDGRFEYKDIEIRLTKAGRQFAVAHVLHSKQEISANADGTYTMTVPAKATHLAVQWILSQRGNATPVAPAELVEDVIATSRRITKSALSQSKKHK